MNMKGGAVGATNMKNVSLGAGGERVGKVDGKHLKCTHRGTFWVLAMRTTTNTPNTPPKGHVLCVCHKRQAAKYEKHAPVGMFFIFVAKGLLREMEELLNTKNDMFCVFGVAESKERWWWTHGSSIS